MKKILALVMVGFALALLSSSASAQSYNLNTAINGGTNNIAASTTNSSTYAVVIPNVKSAYIAVQPTFKLTGAGTSASVFVFDRSVDGSTWEAGAHRVIVTANGTSTVTAVTNITIGAQGYLRLSSIENPNGTAMTNIVVKYSQKTGI